MTQKMTPQDAITQQKLISVVGWIKGQKALNDVANVPVPYRRSIVDIPDQFVQVAECFIGVSEIGSTNTGYWVDRALAAANLRPKNPWCISLDQLIIQIVSEANELPDLLPFDSGSTQKVVNWALTQRLCVESYALAKPGDLMVLRNGNDFSGHSKLITADAIVDNRLYFQTVGGNESNTDWRNGGGTRLVVLDPEKEYGPYQKAKAKGAWCPGIISAEKLVRRIAG